ncbi:MAG: hypothetical protein KUL82_01110 [Bdellovibrio sp.]|nr:hypothetical protein [Bdellovibrio sp.]
MRNTLLITLMLSLSLVAGAATAATLKDSLKTLQTYAEKEEHTSSVKTQEVLKVIDQSVTAIIEGKEKASPEFMKALARAAVLTFDADPSEAAGELLLPLQKKNKKALEEAIKSLPKKDADSLRESLKNAAREETQGNG